MAAIALRELLTLELPKVLFASTVEIPYADVAGTAVTPATARAFGHDLARAMRAYLESQPIGDGNGL